jgi:hypothetical protein
MEMVSGMSVRLWTVVNYAYVPFYWPIAIALYVTGLHGFYAMIAGVLLMHVLYFKLFADKIKKS